MLYLIEILDKEGKDNRGGFYLIKKVDLFMEVLLTTAKGTASIITQTAIK